MKKLLTRDQIRACLNQMLDEANENFTEAEDPEDKAGFEAEVDCLENIFETLDRMEEN